MEGSVKQFDKGMNTTSNNASDCGRFSASRVGFSFLSAVAGRFGLRGSYGRAHVAWGERATSARLAADHAVSGRCPASLRSIKRSRGPEMRSKGSSAQFGFWILYRACDGKGTKTNAELFLIDTKSGKTSNGVSPRDL